MRFGLHLYRTGVDLGREHTAAPPDEVLAAFGSSKPDRSNSAGGYRGFSAPIPIDLRGYDGDAMQPFVTRDCEFTDGQFLIFNNLNDPLVNTNLHDARRINDSSWRYEGHVIGVNTDAFEDVPTADRDGVFDCVSTRNWNAVRVSNVRLLEGVSQQRLGSVNFDIEVSRDGQTV